ncbi:MAG: RNA polymerase subunit sigma-24 [Candidatus Wallbacteria bacterium HGW-Wallbacteria-1]|jgi:RNA polymerase sigma-70 factor (ECF subfamily)|uniref:RNA polymerase subunit sigma-24 n=1 Tax=Candidatus Wallbacteria bacterium HGW-Wallbacteria-1 TaxID=2013854 RepID=A0A2N1PML5_9BACT|nr:MAG: RNA polymerase subunit sigma-24 [Candidatus Wallbacteria bacterium HGW-Wallbacteria-1]
MKNIYNNNFTDEELIKKAIDRDEMAFRALVDRYTKKVFNIVFRFLRDTEDSRDVTQEVFINLFKNLDRFDDNYKFSTWLYKIATNQALYRYRSRKKRNSVTSNYAEIPENDPVAIVCPEEETENRIRQEKIMNLVDCLEEKYKTTIILRHVLDLSYEEIQQIMQLPLGTVKTNLFRARAKLKSLMENEEFFA